MESMRRSSNQDQGDLISPRQHFFVDHICMSSMRGHKMKEFSPFCDRPLGREIFWLVHGSVRVCLGFGGSRSRLPDKVSRKPAFMSRVLRLVLLEPQRAVLQAPTLIGRAGFIVWHTRRTFRGMSMGLEAFLELPGVSGLRLCARTHLKTALCNETYDKYRVVSL